MGVVGVLMIVTGALQLWRPRARSESRTEPTAVDGLTAGAAQGLAALPGLSRSGLTIAALLGRRIERGEALVLSYLMSIPASLGAGMFALAEGGVASSWPALAAAVVAFGVGLVTIRALLAFAQRVNLGGFVAATGAVMVAGAVWQAVG